MFCHLDQLVVGLVLKNEDITPIWPEARETSPAHGRSRDLPREREAMLGILGKHPFDSLARPGSAACLPCTMLWVGCLLFSPRTR